MLLPYYGPKIKELVQQIIRQIRSRILITFQYSSAFCYMARGQGSGCNAKEGNPFGPFWDTFGVDFAKSEFYGPLNYDVHHQDMARKWNDKYPPQEIPGILFSFLQFFQFDLL